MNKSQPVESIGFSGLLTMAFIVLKLTGYIDWSWWWVTIPIWGPVALMLAMGLMLWIMGTIVVMAETQMKKKTQKKSK